MTETSYLVKNEKEYDFIAKRLDKQGYKWSDGDSLTGSGFVPDLPALIYIDAFAFKRVTFQSVNDVIAVSDLMKPNKDVIYMTPAEKAEFYRLKHHYISLYIALTNVLQSREFSDRLFDNINESRDNIAQLEFARAWADPSLIVVNEPKFAYKLKPKFQAMLYVTSAYLSINGVKVPKPEYHTAEEWKTVDNEVKQIFDRVAEK